MGENGTIQSKPFIKPKSELLATTDSQNRGQSPLFVALGTSCTSHSDAVEAQEILINRLIRHLASPSVVQRVRDSETSQAREASRSTAKMKWRKDVGHVPISPSLGHTLQK